jgi:tripartite-type tricarboxylate transporter receptor subunit TctC
MVAVTGPQRTAVAPEVPTVRESGLPDFSVVAWYGVHVPARTPRPIVDALNGQMRKLLSSGDTRQRLLGQGMEPALTTPDEFADFVRSEVARWTKVIRNAGITEN